MKNLLPPAAALALAVACAGTTDPSGNDDPKIEKARALLAAGDPDGALAITDELLARRADWRAARLVAGDSYLALSKIDRRGLRRDLVLADAASSYERALDSDQDDPTTWLHLAEVRYELGAFVEARTAALKSAEQLGANKAEAEVMAPSVLLAARCDLRELAVARQHERDKNKPDERGFVKVEPATAQIAAAALQRFNAVQGLLPAEGYRGAAQVYQWLDQFDHAVAELERGIRAAPEVAELHLAYQQMLVDLGQTRALVGAYSRMLRENPGASILLWFQGRAQVILADDLRKKSNFQGAIDNYRHAAEIYGQYGAMVPAHAESTNQWIAICQLSIARVACDSGDLKTARQYLDLADQTSPLTTSYPDDKPQVVDSFGSHYLGVVVAIGRALANGGEESLPQTLAFHEHVLEKHPGKWGFVYNNAALPARDLGVLRTRNLGQKSEAERQAAMQEAMELWERSYRYYEEAVKLSPDDARIINDCGLMLIYHLNRDFDHARELFDRAIAVGQRQLDALPGDTSADERNLLEEAVGDAWQNIGVLMSRHLQRPFAEMKPFLEKAITYYPYRQREAARMLQNEGRESDGNGNNPRTLRGRGSAEAADSPAAQGGAADKCAAAKAAADKKAADGDLDGALAVLDDANKELKAYGPFQALRGDYTLRYARAARDEGRKGVELLYQDAVAALKKAVELDSEPSPPRLRLAEAQFEQGANQDAMRTAAALLLHMQSQGGGQAELVAAAHAVRADAAAREFIARKGEGKDGPQELQDARTSFRYLEQKHKLTPALQKTWSGMEGWAGSPTEAVGVWVRALQQQPGDQTLLEAAVTTAVALKQVSAAVDALKGRDDAASVWYVGKARFYAAADLRISGKTDDALAELDRARACFEKSMQKERSFEPSCRQWLAICLGKKGNIAFWADRFDDAEKWLLEAARLQPDRINEDLGTDETTKIGLLRLIDRHFKQQDLGKAAAVALAAAAAADTDLDLLNNAGLFARDHGNQVEAAGKKKEALALYEQSYRAYTQAQRLDPDNVRLRNDTALIAIYHLERDWDQNQQLLEQAIVLGDKQLAAFAADDPEGRRQLDEAVGDCWENLALLHLKHDKNGALAKAAAEKSMQHHPGQGRGGARRHLQAAEKLLQEK